MSRARAAFLADQWEAACAESQDMFVGTMLRRGVTLEALSDVAATPLSRRVWQRFADRLRAGETTACEHLAGATPGRVFWVSESPEMLRCRLCAVSYRATVTADHLSASTECASCGSPTDRPSTLTLVIGPVGISAQICPACRRPEHHS